MDRCNEFGARPCECAEFPDLCWRLAFYGGDKNELKCSWNILSQEPDVDRGTTWRKSIFPLLRSLNHVFLTFKKDILPTF